jgi:exosortase E/protease (VPEID-CTERM system)
VVGDGLPLSPQIEVRRAAVAVNPRLFFRRGAVLAFVLLLEGLRSSINIGSDRSSLARWFLAFVSMFIIFGFPRFRTGIRFVSRDLVLPPVSWNFIAWHICMLATLAIASRVKTNSAAFSSALIAIWLCAGAGAIVFACVAAFPVRLWAGLLRGTAKLSVYAFATAGIVWSLVPRLWTIWSQTRWSFATDLTFWLVNQLLRAFLPAITQDVAKHVIGSDRFSVAIGGSCSGWEGLALMAVFSPVWLWISRRQYRFPHALTVIPAALILIFLLNAVRIAALILIGHAGAPLVAMTGFHSQAGWIAFNLVALGISLISPRIQWLRAREREPRDQAGHNPVVAFLLPFAVILAAGMISRATADQFEWFYPLRFFAAAPILWFYRRDYNLGNWKPDWFPVVAGTMVFGLWLALDRGTHADNGIATGLAAMSAPARIGWLSFRTLAAVTTVPLAEELAFRGFLLRRMISVEFEAVDFRRVWYPAVVGSSIAFGLMHGDRWLAGTFAGAVYAAAMLRRGRIGDAILAHSVTNALLAGWVLFAGKWSLW